MKERTGMSSAGKALRCRPIIGWIGATLSARLTLRQASIERGLTNARSRFTLRNFAHATN